MSQCMMHRALLISFCIYAVSSLEVLNMTEEVSVQNGSEAIKLDCPYQLESGDDKLLVIKWYYNKEDRPAYQWIPNEIPPQSFGILKDRIDETYMVTDDDFSKHRALYILNPTVELSGSYQCCVSNYFGEESAVIHLTVYIPPTAIIMDYETADDSITVYCSAEGIFPEPIFDLYRSMNEETEAMQLTKTNAVMDFDDVNQTFSVNLEKTFNQVDLDYSNTFQCSLTIPRTDFQINESFIYQPDPTTTTTSTTTTTTTTTPPPYLALINPSEENNEAQDDDPNSSSNNFQGESCLILSTFFVTVFNMLLSR